MGLQAFFDALVKRISGLRKPTDFGKILDSASVEPVMVPDRDERIQNATRVKLNAELPGLISSLRQRGYRVESQDDPSAAFVIVVTGCWDDIPVTLKFSGRFVIRITTAEIDLGLLIDENCSMEQAFRNVIYRIFQNVFEPRLSLPAGEALKRLARWIGQNLQPPSHGS